MSILNFGSLNIDHVYRVDQFVQPGQTIDSRSYNQFAGGKGYNQSMALAKAGAPVFHAGRIGEDGSWLLDRLSSAGADVSNITVGDTPSGHAVIQVDDSGENCIVLHGGANREMDPAFVKFILESFGKGDWLLLQNEISCLPDIMKLAAERGMRIAFNPAPMGSGVTEYPLETVSVLILNESEGRALSGVESVEEILPRLRKRYPDTMLVLTLGTEGVLCEDAGKQLRVPARDVKAVDTTAAGDTFVGFFLAALLEKQSVDAALQLACRAAALSVQKLGAADSIPLRKEVEALDTESTN